MLSRTLRRTLLSSQCQMPPTFLLPWTAGLTTISHTAMAPNEPPPLTRKDIPQSTKPANANSQAPIQIRHELTSLATTPLALSQSVKDLLPLLAAQNPHYINVHIHGKPYLLTEGDTLRLPFLMHGVEPGDVLRLNRALHLGSRDFTLKAGAAPARIRSSTTGRTAEVPTPTGVTEITATTPPTTLTGENPDESATTPLSPTSLLQEQQQQQQQNSSIPHFIPHIAKDKHAYLDERLYECRAVVLGTESEPMRVKEKTKRRQRHIKRVRSKHRFTLIKIKEVRVRSVDELRASGEAHE